MTSLLDRILEAKTKGATFSKDELEALAAMEAGPTKSQTQPKPSARPPPSANACQREWIVRQGRKDLHDTKVYGPRHICSLNNEHLGDHRCSCGASLTKREKNEVESVSFATFKKSPVIYEEPQSAPQITAEEAGARDAPPAKDNGMEIVECDTCHKPMPRRGLHVHKRLAHGTLDVKKKNATHLREVTALFSGDFKCTLCGRDFEKCPLGPVVIHMIHTHGLEKPKAREVADASRVKKPVVVVDHVRDTIIAEAKSSGLKGRTVMDLAKAASIMSQKAETIALQLVKESVFKIDQSWGVPKFIYTGAKHDSL